MKCLFLLAFLSTSALANLHLAPPDFDTDMGVRAVFVDFKHATYDITYDLKHHSTIVKSRIEFTSTKAGFPVLDLIPKVKKLSIDGSKSGLLDISLPGKASKAKLLYAYLEPGDHVLEVENKITKNTYMSDNRVNSAFWIRDLKDRMFLEQYFPSNFEFDQYKMTFNVSFVGGHNLKQEFYTNGNVTKVDERHYKIEFPDYFTVSCPYFHTNRKGIFRRMDFTHKSVSGRDIPMTVYTPWFLKTSKFKKYALEVMAELENDYGPWGHPAFLGYGTIPGMGGMEHAGATATSLAALDHEMLHSYFAKGVMPANGNSGWIDEAIASWRDKGYQRLPLPGFGGSNLGRGSIYKRNTDDRAYKLGAAFMGHLDYLLQNTGGLKAFLRGYFSAYKHMVITQDHFKNNLEFFSGLDLTEEFNTYVWGTNSDKTTPDKNPHHPELTESQLQSLL